MLDLCAITGLAAQSRVRANPRKHYKECRRDGVYMRIEGDRPVSAFFLDATEWTLICCASLHCPESHSNVAAYLGGLYRERGDGFACGLRGTFAIILYDHNQRTLKAWTDHFGAERLVYSES